MGHKNFATNFGSYQLISMQMNWKQFTHSCPVFNKRSVTDSFLLNCPEARRSYGKDLDMKHYI